MRSILFGAVIYTAMFFAWTKAYSGILLGIAPRWQTLSLRALDEEATPNYYGYGIDLDLGYSFSGTVDFSLYGDYLPAQRITATLGKEKVQFREYGAKIGIRIDNTIYIAIRGGTFVYRLLFRTDPTEQGGEWMGPGGALSLGALKRSDKEHYYHIAIDLGSATLKRYDTLEEKNRVIDTLGVSLRYVFVKFDGFKVGSLFGGGFFKSLDI